MKIGRKIVWCENENEFLEVLKMLDLKYTVTARDIHTGWRRGKLIVEKNSEFADEIPEKVWKGKDFLVAGEWSDVFKRDGRRLIKIRFTPFWIKKLKEFEDLGLWFGLATFIAWCKGTRYTVSKILEKKKLSPHKARYKVRVALRIYEEKEGVIQLKVVKNVGTAVVEVNEETGDIRLVAWDVKV